MVRTLFMLVCASFLALSPAHAGKLGDDILNAPDRVLKKLPEIGRALKKGFGPMFDDIGEEFRKCANGEKPQKLCQLDVDAALERFAKGYKEGWQNAPPKTRKAFGQPKLYKKAWGTCRRTKKYVAANSEPLLVIWRYLAPRRKQWPRPLEDTLGSYADALTAHRLASQAKGVALSQKKWHRKIILNWPTHKKTADYIAEAIQNPKRKVSGCWRPRTNALFIALGKHQTEPTWQNLLPTLVDFLRKDTSQEAGAARTALLFLLAKRQ